MVSRPLYLGSNMIVVDFFGGRGLALLLWEAFLTPYID
jgi:hypothetical protein